MEHLFILGALLSAVPPAIYTLDTGVAVWDVATYDVNGDKKADLFALCCDEKSYPLNKFVAVFLANPEGGYPQQPSFKLTLDPSIGCLFFAEVDGSPPRELVATNAEGATIYSFQENQLIQTGEYPFVSLLPGGSKEPLFLKKTATDLNGDGIDEWLIPVPSGYEVRNATGLLRRLDCNVISELRSNDTLSISHRLPVYHLMTLDNQQQKDLAFLSDEFADFWYGDNWREHKRFKIPFLLDEKWDSSAKMEDIDGNGLPDLIVSQTKGTVNIQAHTQVYMASAPFTYPEKPTASFEAKGSLTSPMLIDVNDDEKLDLIFITVPIGVKFFVNYFMMGKLSVLVAVHLFNGQGYEDKPDFKATLSFDAPEGRERTAYALGDFNGDGRIDAAFGTGADKMIVRIGSKAQFLLARPWQTLTLPPFGIARAVELNEDKRQELLVFHPGGENKTLVHVVFFP